MREYLIEPDKKLTIFIMAYNRPEYLKAALDSVLNQTYKNIEVVVSDNSTDDRVEKLINENYQKLRYIRRRPSLDVLSHHNVLIEESDSEFATYFHDDDVMCPQYAEKMLEIFSNNKDIVAAAPNATLINGVVKSNNTFNSISKLKLVSQGYELLQSYFEFGGDGYAPFPGYMYRVSKVKRKQLLSSDAGRHADYTFLDSLLGEGILAWSEEVLMQYRVHVGSSAATELLADRRKLIIYIIKKYKLSKKDPLILTMRYKFLLSWNAKNTNRKRKMKKVLIKLGIIFFIKMREYRNTVKEKIFPTHLFIKNID